jgi:DNA modification methylase
MSVRIIQGDIRTILPTLQADSFDCIVTSPPYYGLRDYGTATWEGGDPACDHVGPPIMSDKTGLSHPELKSREKLLAEPYRNVGVPYRNVCAKCGARRVDAQIGLEPTLAAYLETIVAVCRELRRVLKPSGIMFLNIGDSYAGSGKGGNPPESKHKKQATNAGSLIKRGRKKTLDFGDIVWEHGPPHEGPIDARAREFGIKQKDLMLVPERLGIALQADGWWVRSHIIWAKKNCMPESCADRPTSAHETVWMLTKRARYFWDTEAVKEESAGPGKICGPKSDASRNDGDTCGTVRGDGQSRNLRNVWHMASYPYPDAHFATFPPDLAARCIKAGSSERGCCHECGAPWVRDKQEKACYKSRHVPMQEMQPNAPAGIVRKRQPKDGWPETALSGVRCSSGEDVSVGGPDASEIESKEVSRNARRRDGGAEAEISSCRGQRVDACGRSQIPEDEEGARVSPLSPTTTGEDGGGADCWSDEMQQKARDPYRCAGGIFEGRVAGDNPASEETMLPLQEEVFSSHTTYDGPYYPTQQGRGSQPSEHRGGVSAMQLAKTQPPNTSVIGWHPSCACTPANPVPSKILDCFAGAGTTGLVADRLGRDCTLIDLNTEYAEMALNRIKDDCPMFAEVAAE